MEVKNNNPVDFAKGYNLQPEINQMHCTELRNEWKWMDKTFLQMPAHQQSLSFQMIYRSVDCCF